MTNNPPSDLDSASQARLRDVLAQRPRGLFSDVDGTLSAIAPTPGAAVLLPGVGELLGRARTRFDVVAAISGRAAEDTRRLVGIRGLLYLGNHGLERLDPDTDKLHILPEAEPYIKAINLVMAEVELPLAKAYPGLLFERKGVTASIHVRNTVHPDEAERAVYKRVSEAAQKHGLPVTQGRKIIEIRPPVQANKGTAVADLVRTAGLRGGLYLGDDRTDLDAFRVLRQLTLEGICQGVAVAVLHNEAPPRLAEEADITLPSIDAVPGFLRWLVERA
ncbi:MAG TPA: trehalose-phosphatase [Ktedonobacterales bacterium]|nr:trehalose-phosphatase [Ktedonobacterales bacterium]